MGKGSTVACLLFNGKLAQAADKHLQEMMLDIQTVITGFIVTEYMMDECLMDDFPSEVLDVQNG